MTFKKHIEKILADNHIDSDWIDDNPEKEDKWDLMVSVYTGLDVAKLVLELHGIAWVQIMEDYDGWLVYVKQGPHMEDE